MPPHCTDCPKSSDSQGQSTTEPPVVPFVTYPKPLIIDGVEYENVCEYRPAGWGDCILLDDKVIEWGAGSATRHSHAILKPIPKWQPAVGERAVLLEVEVTLDKTGLHFTRRALAEVHPTHIEDEFLFLFRFGTPDALNARLALCNAFQSGNCTLGTLHAWLKNYRTTTLNYAS
jgi:hypothetical protein